MIVCVCKRVSERQLTEAIADGASTVKALSRQTGCGTQCGRCIPTVREMLNSETYPLPMVENRRLPSLPLTALVSA